PSHVLCTHAITVFYVPFFHILPPPPTTKLFPYTTLFRSCRVHRPDQGAACEGPRRETPGDHAREPVDHGVRRSAHRDDLRRGQRDRKSTRLNSSHDQISYAVFCLKKKKHARRNSSINCTI